MFEPLQVAGLALVALAYWRRASNLAGAGRPVPGRRQALFAVGLLLAGVALASPVDHLGEELVSAHMVQHLLLGDIAALFLVAGITGPVLRPLLARRSVGWLRALAHPAIALPLWAANLYLWHIPALYEAAVAVPALHALEHACFLATGMLVWAPLFGPLPRPSWFGDGAALGYVLAVRGAGAVLANLLLFADFVLYDAYRPEQREWAVSPLADQAAAGGIMLTEGGAVTLVVLAWIIAGMLRRTEESRQLVELARERGVALDPHRARRAVAAGVGASLRRRIDQSSE